MSFAGIPNGSQVFIDANTLVYNAAADPKYGVSCKQLMERIARQQIEAYTSVISQQHGLLTGDALIVALMRQYGLTLIASEDADFDRAPGIKRYAPL